MTWETDMCMTQDDREIAAFFDRCAEKGLMCEFDDAEREKLARFLLHWDVQGGQRILEPGCGSGRLTWVLAGATAPGGEVYANDLSPAMIRLAHERKLPSYVHFSCGSVSHIDREDGCFDQVICLNVFPHIVDKTGALKEFARVLKNGGRLWINHFRNREDLNHFHEQAAPEISGHVLPDEHAMRRMMHEAGFDVTDILDDSGGYSLRAVKHS